MLEPIRELNRSYLEHMQNSGDAVFRQFDFLRHFLIERRCTFKGEPMPTLLKPNFTSTCQTGILIRAVETMSRALNKFILLYMENQQVREIMKFSDRENELFSIEPGYSKPLVIARLDAFLQDYSLKFLEFNCDSPAGIAYADVLEDGFRELFREYSFLGDWNIGFTRRQDLLLSSLLECYGEFKSGSLPEKPVIAIVDWDDVSTHSEFELHVKHFAEKGFETLICSPMKFSIKNGKTFALDREVHLVYRRVITRELLQRWDEVNDFIESIKQGLVCCCNSFRACIVGNKKVLSLITDPRFQHIYTVDELNLIKKTIPWTRILADAEVQSEGRGVRLRKFTQENKDHLVLKPSNMYGGKDVYIGHETGQQKWVQIIEEHIGDESWVVQEYVDIPRDGFPEMDNPVSVKEKYVNINPFALLERYCGAITRVSDSSVINVSAGGGLVPTLLAERLSLLP